jgi:hypothetical protein
MADSEMDLTILLQQRDKEIAGLKASLRSTRAQHTSDLATTVSAANDLVAFVKGAEHDGTAADIVSAVTELAVLVKAAADVAADQSVFVGHAVDDVVDVEGVEHRDIAAEAAADVVKSANDDAVNLGATADIDRTHGDVGRGEFRGGDGIERSEEREVVGKPDEMIEKSSKTSTFPHPQNLKVIMGNPDEVSERQELEEENDIFIL